MCSGLVLSPGGYEQPWPRWCQQTSSPSLDTDARLPENHQICHLLLFFFRVTLWTGVFFISFYFLLLRLIELRKKHAEGELPSLSSEQIIGQAIIIIIIIL